MNVRLGTSLRLAAIVAAISATLGGAEPGDGTRAGATAAVAPPPPPVELVETVPLETPLGNPDLRSAAAVWLELVRGATQSLEFEEFYLSNWPGEPLEPVLNSIVESAKRGVKVRILLDARMHRTYPMPADSLAKIPGITVRTIDLNKITGGIQHAKFFIVDGGAVYLGSQNMDWRALEHIHELGVLVRDERVAQQFQRVFEMDWGTAELQATAADSSRLIGVPAAAATATALPFRIVQAPGDTVLLWPSWNPKSFSPDSTMWDLEALVRSIDGARSEIVAQSLNYSTGDSAAPDTTLDAALRRAAARGVRVRLVISDWIAGGRGMKALAALSGVPNVEVKLSQVPEWSKAYVPFARVEHCKYMVADTTVTWVGTSNWEPSYFHRLRNVAVTMQNRPLALSARRVFEASWIAPTTAKVTPGTTFAPRNHGANAPPGVVKYGE